MKVADESDYDDYSEYADFLAQHLVELLYANGINSITQSRIYEWIQEFNRSLHES